VQGDDGASVAKDQESLQADEEDEGERDVSGFVGIKKDSGKQARDISAIDSAFYDSVYGSSPEYRIDPSLTHWHRLWQIATRGIPKDARVLDLGCGPGQVACMLRDDGITSYVGVDWSEEAVSMAMAKCPEFRFEIIDLRDAPGARKLIERVNPSIILVIETLEHIQDDLGVLASVPVGMPIRITIPSGEAYSHARWFTSEATIRERYGGLLEIESVERVAPSWWAMVGKRV
jgi:SAM-dependent methyltransferase